MAKRTRSTGSAATESHIHHSDGKLEAFAEDLGRLLGDARNKADSWLAQRKVIAQHLIGVRDTANQLLAQLGIAGSGGDAPRRGRPAGSGPAKRGPGRPPKTAVQDSKPARKRRTMSAAARRKIGAAQRARWAKVKAEKAR
jgi:hypothetical protein